MLAQFPEWSASIAEYSPLSGLANATVGIDAADYLARLHEFRTPKLPDPAGILPEPLLPALGGLPYGLTRVVEKHLEIWRRNGISPLFVFDGLEISKPSLGPAELAASKLEQAWQFYDSNDAMTAVDTFRISNAIRPSDLFRFLQTILRANEVPWLVAPYTAIAQLHYFVRNDTVDTICAASEALLYDVPEVITSWDFLEEKAIWVRRRNAMQFAGSNLTSDAFLDACLLSGCELGRGIPQLDHLPQKRPKLVSAAEMVRGIGGGTGNGVCLHWNDQAPNANGSYIDIFRKARMTVKHHVVMKDNGRAEPLDKEHAPGKIHEFMGQRLPDELYFYFSKGIIGARLLNWRASGQFLVPPPLDGGDSDSYRSLVQRDLTSIQIITIGLLASSMHNYYQNTNVTKTVWFDQSRPQTIEMKNEFDSFRYKDVINSWLVPASLFGEEFNKYQGSSIFGLCVKSIQNRAFASKTVTDTKKRTPRTPLTLKDELLANSIWRMLQIRGYLDDGHQLTAKGEMLLATISALPLELEENALIACELVNLRRLNSEDLSTYSGVPDAQLDSIKGHMTLISRVACLGTLKHMEIGYTGVLSRNMLSYLGFIEAVRQSLRDLLEVCLTTLLMNGDAVRTDRQDWNELGLDLPFVLPLSCSLGVAVAYHLTECGKWHDPRSQSARRSLTEDEQSKFYYAVDLPGSFQTAWKLWDAVVKGVKAGRADVDRETRQAFVDADDWLKPYR